jgi:hypothetical protein
VLEIIQPLWTTKTETAARLRGRLEAILDWAKARNYRAGENPACWRGHLDKLLPAKRKVAPTTHHKALPYTEMPAFMAELRNQTGAAARCLEFTILSDPLQRGAWGSMVRDRPRGKDLDDPGGADQGRQGPYGPAQRSRARAAGGDAALQ